MSGGKTSGRGQNKGSGGGQQIVKQRRGACKNESRKQHDNGSSQTAYANMSCPLGVTTHVREPSSRRWERSADVNDLPGCGERRRGRDGRCGSSPMIATRASAEEARSRCTISRRWLWWPA